MTITGIVVEYNPLHLGHMHHIEKAKQQTHADLLIAVMSSSVVQRGEFAVANKFIRTNWALKAGIDMVVELPGFFTLQNANIFANTAVQILNHLGVTDIVFGSEHGEITPLKTSAEIMRTNAYDEKIQHYLHQGFSYPSSADQALSDMTGNTIHKNPNDILGIQYINAVYDINASIKLHAIKRIQSEYYGAFDNNKTIQSATALRNRLFRQKSIEGFVPAFVLDTKFTPLNTADAFPFIQYRLLTHNKDTLKHVFSFDEGLEGLFLKHKDKHSLSEMIDALSTRRYTHAKLKRSLMHMLINTQKTSIQDFNVPYVRVLGMNTRAQEHLNKIKKTIHVPLITKLKRERDPLLDIELTITRLRDFLSGENTLKKEFEPVTIL